MTTTAQHLASILATVAEIQRELESTRARDYDPTNDLMAADDTLDAILMALQD